MKKKIQIESHICDGCKKRDDYPSVCLGCGKEFCYECSKKNGIEYSHRVYFAGHGDGFYCNTCDRALRSRAINGKPEDPVHSAFVAIHNFKLNLQREKDFKEKEIIRLESNLSRINPNER